MGNVEKLIGNRISEARTSRKLTQEDLAEQCGISVSSLSRIETGHNSTSLKTLLAIADALEIGLDYLLYDLFPQADSTYRSPKMQEIFFLLEDMTERDLSFVQEFLALYSSRIQK